MVAIFLLVLAYLALFTGLGLPFATHLRQPVPETLFGAFFTGWCLALTALQIWHLLLPVNLAALLLATLLALAGWHTRRRVILPWLTALPKSLIAILGVVSFGLLFLLVNHALYASSAYDHGLYHLPMVRWLQTAPIVPGLGNLHHRLAFNNASFLVVAMLDTGIQQGLIYYTATTLLFAALALRGLLGIYRLAQAGKGLRDGFYTLLLPVTLWFITLENNTYAGYSTDYVIYIFQAVLAAELLHFFQQAQDGVNRSDRAAQARLLLFGLAVGLAVKFSFAAFYLGMLGALIWGWQLGAKATRAETRALWACGAGITALVMLPWLLRNALLSGYLLFPNTAIALPVPWKIPAALADAVQSVIRTWARTNGNFPPDAPFRDWLQWWWQRRSYEFKELWGVTGTLTLLALALRSRRAALTHSERGLWALFAAVIAALLFWFWMAPAVRFAAALLWIMPLIPMLVLAQHAMRLRWLPAPKVTALAGFAVALLLWLQPVFTNNFSRAWLLAPPREREIATSLMQHDPLRARVTNSGLVVYIASDEFEERCFDQPLPCTRLHEFSAQLALRQPGNLRAGFWMDTTTR